MVQLCDQSNHRRIHYDMDKQIFLQKTSDIKLKMGFGPTVRTGIEIIVPFA